MFKTTSKIEKNFTASVSSFQASLFVCNPEPKLGYFDNFKCRFKYLKTAIDSRALRRLLLLVGYNLIHISTQFSPLMTLPYRIYMKFNKRDSYTSSLPLEVVEEVEKLLREIDPTKACTPDSFPSLVLKERASELSPSACKLFNKSISSGTFP
jgi:hypothetical protein